jgi:hypothetical protein
MSGRSLRRARPASVPAARARVHPPALVNGRSGVGFFQSEDERQSAAPCPHIAAGPGGEYRDGRGGETDPADALETRMRVISPASPIPGVPDVDATFLLYPLRAKAASALLEHPQVSQIRPSLDALKAGPASTSELQALVGVGRSRSLGRRARPAGARQAQGCGLPGPAEGLARGTAGRVSAGRRRRPSSRVGGAAWRRPRSARPTSVEASPAGRRCGVPRPCLGGVSGLPERGVP